MFTAFYCINRLILICIASIWDPLPKEGISLFVNFIKEQKIPQKESVLQTQLCNQMLFYNMQLIC